MMESTIFFYSSSSKNMYMYDFKLRSYTLSHPQLKLCYDLEQDAGLPSSYLELMEIKPEIARYYEQEDIKYYFYKYHHLKSCGYFSKMEKKMNGNLKINIDCT